MNLPVVSLVAPCNGSGKTRLAVALLRAFPDFAAVKVSTIYRDGGNCPRSPEHGCACARLGREPFHLVTEPAILGQADTDTGAFVAAGARTLWVVCRPGEHAAAWEAVRAALPGVPLLTEGSRVAEVCAPALTVAVVNPRLPRERWKEGSEAVLRGADLVVVNRFGEGPETSLPSRPLCAWDGGAGLPREVREAVARVLGESRPGAAPPQAFFWGGS